MSEFHYVVNETREQAYERKMRLQTEKARLVRLMKDPKIQEAAMFFIKQNRLPKDDEALYLAPFFGKSYRFWYVEAWWTVLAVLLLNVGAFLIGAVAPPFIKETCLFVMAVADGVAFLHFFFGVFMMTQVRNKELAICLLVDSYLKQTQKKNSP